MTVRMWHWLSFRPQNWDYWGRLETMSNCSKVHHLLLKLASCGLNYGTRHWTMGNKVQSLCRVFITSWLTPVLSNHLAPSATASKTDIHLSWTRLHCQPTCYQKYGNSLSPAYLCILGDFDSHRHTDKLTKTNCLWFNSWKVQSSRWHTIHKETQSSKETT